MVKPLGRAVLIAAALATIGCDRVTKHAAETLLADAPGQSYLGDMIRLAYVENPGGFWSLGAGLPQGVRTTVFTVLTGLALLLLVVLTARRCTTSMGRLGLTLFVAGGASNWIDRVLRGSVVDFLNVGVGPLRTGIFNVADVAIMLGACVFLLAEFRAPALPPATPREGSQY